MLPFRPPSGLASIYLTRWKFLSSSGSSIQFFVSDSVINNVRLSRFNFFSFLFWFLIPNWLAHFFFLYSVDWFNQLGIVTFTRTIFGRPLSTEKCAIDSSYRWTGYVFILTFCLFCQTIRPNIPQVIILIRRKRISFWFCLKLL